MELNRKILLSLAVVLLLSVPLMTSVSVLALNYDHPTKAPNGPKGNSNVAHLYLVEKDPNDWTIVVDGACGKMKYNLEGSEFEYVFNGHNLKPDTKYTLIYYGDDTHNDEWPYATCIDSGTSDLDGDLHLKGSFDFKYDLEDAKIWLVLSEDVDDGSGQMIDWDPEEYLFEYDVIDFVDN